MQEYLWVYILRLVDGHLYTGYAKDVEQRYKKHRAGKASRITRAFPPTALEQCWKIFGSSGDAMRVESLIKKLTRKKKLELIDKPKMLVAMVNEQIDGLRIETCDIGDLVLE